MSPTTFVSIPLGSSESVLRETSDCMAIGARWSGLKTVACCLLALCLVVGRYWVLLLRALFAWEKRERALPNCWGRPRMDFWNKILFKLRSEQNFCIAEKVF